MNELGRQERREDNNLKDGRLYHQGEALDLSHPIQAYFWLKLEQALSFLINQVNQWVYYLHLHTQQRELK